MNVSLPEEMERWVADRVERGEYPSAEAAVAEGLRLLAERDAWRAEVRAKIEEGYAQAEAGDLIDGEEAFRRVRDRLMKRHGERDRA